jgi:hypothetical protein
MPTNYTSGSTRVPLSQTDGTVVLDSRRTRPMWFDGRFMAARDLEREQNYFLQREADMGQASGFEGIRGLTVDQLASNGQTVAPGAIVIHAGTGITPAGELVMVSEDLTIQLSELPEQDDLGVQLTTPGTPKQCPQKRTGLYIVALQPVEFTADPITKYPTTVQGPRSTHYSDIVEATAVSLVPYPNPPTNYSASLQQAALARQIFLVGNPGKLPDSLLPLAVISLERGAVQWIDQYLVRRENGTQLIPVGFGLNDQITQQAYLMQYDTQLQAVVASRRASGLKANFAATDYFLALPAVGRVPFDAIDTTNFSHVFFPQEMDVRLSIIPNDDLAALLQQGMELPAIDLTLAPSAFANMTVFVFVPVDRNDFAALKSSLPLLAPNPTLPQVLANRSPLQLLQLFQGGAAIIPVPPVANSSWASVIGNQQYGFYLRWRDDAPLTSFKTPAGVVTLTSSANPSTEGASVTFTAQVLPAGATGSVQFNDGATSLGSGNLSSGIATLATSSLSAGPHVITAVYSPTTPGNAPAKSAPLTQTVVKSTSSVTLSSSTNPSTSGQSVTLTATVTPNSATGSVTFSGLGAATLSGGVATLAHVFSAGTFTITATYGGDANTSGSTSAPVTQTAGKGTASLVLSSSVNPSTVGQAIVLNAKVTPSTATGVVQFLDGGTSMGTSALSGGAATLPITSLAAGTHSITSTYAGDANNGAATSAAITQTVNKVASSVTLTSSVNPSAQGQSVTLAAKVTPASATGTVQFLDGTTLLASVTLNGGAAAMTTSTLAIGTHTITASYSGDNSNAASVSTAVTQTVGKVISSVALSSSANPSAQGQAVTFTAKITPVSATGTVNFLDGTTALGTGTVSGGVATFTTSNLTAGTHPVTASYAGDTNNAAATSAPLTQTVAKQATSVTLTSSATTSNPKQSVTFTAKVTPSTATGSVQFLDGATVIGTGTLSGGVATLPIETLQPGTHTITAAYGGDASNASSTSGPVTQIVKAVSSVALSSAPNPSIPGQVVVFTARVTPATATGDLQFLEGTTVFGTGTLNGGVAMMSISTLALGAHTITANYAGDAQNVSSSASVVHTVNSPLTGTTKPPLPGTTKPLVVDRPIVNKIILEKENVK